MWSGFTFLNDHSGSCVENRIGESESGLGELFRHPVRGGTLDQVESTEMRDVKGIHWGQQILKGARGLQKGKETGKGAPKKIPDIP